MGELKKVEKDIVFRYDILSDIIVSPARIEILRSLSDYPNGLSFEKIVNHIPEDMRQRNIQKHLDQLIKEGIVGVNVIAFGDNPVEKKYSLTESGKVNYDKLVEIASELKAEESHRKSE
jgi:DNA-binding HxlR family transcriptional regulator